MKDRRSWLFLAGALACVLGPFLVPHWVLAVAQNYGHVSTTHVVAGNSVVFQAEAPADSGIRFNWDFGAGAQPGSLCWGWADQRDLSGTRSGFGDADNQ